MQRLNAPAILAAIVAAMIFVARPAAGAPTITAEDEAAIRDLYAGYTQALDFGQADAAAAYFAGGVKTGAEPKGVRHYVANILITPDAAGVKVTASSLTVAETPADGASIKGTIATYTDTLVKTAGGWKFKSHGIAAAPVTKAQAEARAPKIVAAPKVLTANDYADIYRQYATYALTRDAAVFAPGATFASAHTNHKPLPATVSAESASGALLAANISLSLTASGVRGESYAIALSGRTGAGGALEATLSTYDDTLVKTTSGWRFKSREVWNGREKLPPPNFSGIDMSKANGAMGAGTTVAQKAASSQSGPVRPLTARDRFEIEQLFSTYAFGVDTGDGLRRASAFLPNGTITSNLTDHHPGTIADMITRTERIGRKPRPMGGHTFFNMKLTPTAEGAQGVTYALLTNNGKAEEGALRGTPAVYVDTFVRTPNGWRTKDREIWLDNEDVSPYRPGKCARNPCR